MVKLFFVGIIVAGLGVIGVFATILGPLFDHIDANLGHPGSPFHNPVPSEVTTWMDGIVSGVTPGMILVALIGLAFVLFLSTMATYIAHKVRGYRARKAESNELRWRGHVAAVRLRRESEQDSKPNAEFESLWE